MTSPLLNELLPLFHSQRIKQENDVLKNYLKAAQDDVAILLDEKKMLMDTIKSLQVSARRFPSFSNCSNFFRFPRNTESTDGGGATRCQKIVHGLHALLRGRHSLKLAVIGGSAIPPSSFESGQPIFAYFKLNLSMHFFIPLERLLIDWRGAQSNFRIYIRGTLNVCLGLRNWCSLQKQSLLGS